MQDNLDKHTSPEEAPVATTVFAASVAIVLVLNVDFDSRLNELHWSSLLMRLAVKVRRKVCSRISRTYRTLE